jgi:hypothetical protein
MSTKFFFFLKKKKIIYLFFILGDQCVSFLPLNFFKEIQVVNYILSNPFGLKRIWSHVYGMFNIAFHVLPCYFNVWLLLTCNAPEIN